MSDQKAYVEAFGALYEVINPTLEEDSLGPYIKAEQYRLVGDEEWFGDGAFPEARLFTTVDPEPADPTPYLQAVEDDDEAERLHENSLEDCWCATSDPEASTCEAECAALKFEKTNPGCTCGENETCSDCPATQALTLDDGALIVGIGVLAELAEEAPESNVRLDAAKSLVGTYLTIAGFNY